MKTILIFVPSYFPGYFNGGVARSILNTTQWLGEEFKLLVVTCDRDTGTNEPYSQIITGEWIKVGKAHIKYLEPNQLTIIYIYNLIRSTEYQLIHLNSFFDSIFTIKILFLSFIRLIRPDKIILSPRGEFGYGSLKLKYYKKRIYIEILNMLGFYKNIRWHASSDLEAQDISSVLRIPLNIIKVAMDLPIKEFILEQPVERRDERLKVIYLARFTEEKNLDGALRILQSVSKPLDYDVYGIIADHNYWRKCSDLMTKLPHYVNVKYCGRLKPEMVHSVLSNYDLLFFPSHGENYGHVISEALSVGTRVLISTGTPWSQLEHSGLGWVVDLNNINGFVEILNKLAGTPLAERLAIRPYVQRTALQQFFDSHSLKHNRALYND